MDDIEMPRRCLTKGWSPLMTNSLSTKLVPQQIVLESCTDCNTYEKKGFHSCMKFSRSIY